MDKKVISPIVVIILLLFVSISMYLVSYHWFGSFQSNLFSNAKENDKSIDLNDFKNNVIYIRNFESYPINYTQVKIGDVNCDISGEIMPNQYTQINISNCVSLIGEISPREVVIITDNNLYSKVYMIGDN